MNNEIHLVVFSLNEQRYALMLPAVARVVRAVEVTPLPKAPEIVSGAINLQHQIVPVVNVRRRFGMPEKEIDLSDHFIIARTVKRTVALVADSVIGSVQRPQEDVTAAEKIVPGLEYLKGVLRMDDGMILIHDLDQFLSLDEEKQLGESMDQMHPV